MAMMGWGRTDNRITHVETPLYARAAAFQVGDDLVVYACLELLAVSLAVRAEVLKRLADTPLNEHRLMLTATHTHSGPSGYSHYFFLNLNGPGYSPLVVEAIVAGTVAAIRDALANLQPATLRVGTAEMPLKEPVAFNRSWRAYNLNHDVEPVTFERRDEAVYRKMTAVTAVNDHGQLLGSVTWYPVHCTSIHSENDGLHGDNKGVAAAALEERHAPDYVAVVAQEASGDVSPNFRFDRARAKVVGRYDDDLESAEYNGAAQARLAREAIERAQPVAVDDIHGAIHYVDFATIRVDEQFSGVPQARTTSGVIGIAMAEGTDEGPGPLMPVRPLTRTLARLKARATPGNPKLPMLDVGRGLDGNFVGVIGVRGMRVPPGDEAIDYVRRVVKRGKMDNHPWLPQVVPLQLLKIGPLLIAGVPFELTTVAGRRVREQLRALFGVAHVIVNNYANTYSGYCTTFEEYQNQHYEAGYTVWGPHQLAATQTMFAWLARHWEATPLGAAPPTFSDDCLGSRLFEPWTSPITR